MITILNGNHKFRPWKIRSRASGVVRKDTFAVKMVYGGQLGYELFEDKKLFD
jgi:hypothetical protein